jgi:hypothetical protein
MVKIFKEGEGLFSNGVIVATFIAYTAMATYYAWKWNKERKELATKLTSATLKLNQIQNPIES